MAISLTADAGSTKTDWLLRIDEHTSLYSTHGINPTTQSLFDIKTILANELVKGSILTDNQHINRIDELCFYGAGCTSSMQAVMQATIKESFQACGIDIERIEVGSDIIGAALSVCGNQPGIACILGTGSNSCVFDGTNIVANTPPLGYILGDEGSGAAIGRRLINYIYKGILAAEMKECFEKETGLNRDEVIRRVYHEPRANVFLASLSTFIARHIEQEPMLQTMIEDEFTAFIEKNIDPYRRADLSVGAVGSIAWYYQKYLVSALQKKSYRIGMIRKAPLQ